jgi:hypothetical protein
MNSPVWSAELIEPTRTLNGAAEETAKLSVFSEPPGLNVTLDGTDIGQTPVIAKDVMPGIHLLRVKYSERKIVVMPSKPLNLSWFKGSFLEIAEKKKEAPKQPKAQVAEQKKEEKSVESAQEIENLQPLYWPLNPRGPIYDPMP